MRLIVVLACLTGIAWACQSKKTVGTKVPDAFLGIATDTIIVFDPETYKEKVYIVEYETDTRSNEKLRKLGKYSVSTDTIITFDPETYQETIKIVINKVKIE